MNTFGKYIYAAALMLCTAVAASAQSGEDDGPNYINDPESINLVKTVSADPSDRNKYWIELNAFVTGMEKITEDSVPVDFTLVLDLSGSMCRKMVEKSGELHYFEHPEINLSYNNYHFVALNNSGVYTSYFIKDANDNYCEVSRDSGNHCLYYTSSGTKYYFTPSGVQTTVPEGLEDDTVLWGGDRLYTTSRMDALRPAVKNFVSLIRQANIDHFDREDNPEGHRVSLIKFSNVLDNKIGNDFTSGGANKTQILVGMGQDYDSMIEMTDKLEPSGTTHTDTGLNLAYSQMFPEDYTDDGRKKIVLLFTDGDTDHKHDDVIASAKKLKDKNVTIYTVAVFDSNVASSTVDFMSHISSNFPDAESEDNLGAQAANIYSFLATGNELGEIFGTIAKSNTEVSIGYDLRDETALVIDVISEKFMLPVNVSESDIEVYTADYSGLDAEGKHSFDLENKALMTDASIEIDGSRNISVSNFNFDENYCRVTERITAGGTTTFTPHGKEIIIRFPIIPSSNNVGGFDLLTNEANSGIYLEGGSEPIKTFVSPSITLPNIVIRKTGMADGERAIFTITKMKDDDDTQADPLFAPMTVSVISKGGVATAEIIRLREGTYTVTETSAWSWAYTPDNTSVSHKVEATGSDNYKVVYEFHNTAKSNTLKHAENSQNNKFTKVSGRL